MGLKIKDREVYLFQGDSITDSGRRGAEAPLGCGYARMVVDRVIAQNPASKIEFINKGIGGHTVIDLANRWEDDTIRFKPNWLSILIGINDLHRTLGNNNPVTVEIYRDKYDYILDRVVSACKPNIILLEPFYISQDRAEGSHRGKVMAMLPGYIEVVHEMSKKYGTALIRTHEIYQEQIRYRHPDVFCAEPVHPNPTGHMIIADALFREISE